MNQVPLIGQRHSICAIGYARDNRSKPPQLWTGSFVVTPVIESESQESRLVSVPVWTFLSDRALLFANPRFAQNAIEQYHDYFNWRESIQVIMLRKTPQGIVPTAGT